MKKMNYCQFKRGTGKCMILEYDISGARADELAAEIKTFNEDNSSGLYYRCIVDALAVDE